MANLLVMMEFYRGALLPVSLEVLGHARSLGSALGLTVYALVPLPPEPTEEEDITVRCGRFGADKVMLLTGDSLFVEHEMRFEQCADALLSACSMLPPRLLLMGDTPAGRDIMPRLAARLGAAYLPRGAALAEGRHLVLTDATGRHLRIPLEATGAEGIPPLTVPILVTIPAGRHAMAWGDQDAELMIVPPQDESSQTIPNLTAERAQRGGFVEEAIEALPAVQESAAGGAPPICQLYIDKATATAESPLSPFRVGIGSQPEPTMNYQLLLPAEQLATVAEQLRALLAVPGPIAPIQNPGSRPIPTQALDGFDDFNDSTPTEELWDDYAGDTLNGNEATSALIRSTVAETQKSPFYDAQAPSLITPTIRPVDTSTPAFRLSMRNGIQATGNGAAMWEGFATMPDSGGFADDDDGESQLDVAHADTAPVPVVAPVGSKPKEGK